MCFPDKDSKNECSQTQITLKMLDSTESKVVKAKGNTIKILLHKIMSININIWVQIKI